MKNKTLKTNRKIIEVNTKVLRDILQLTAKSSMNGLLERLHNDPDYETWYWDLTDEMQMALLGAAGDISDIRDMLVEALGYGHTGFICPISLLAD